MKAGKLNAQLSALVGGDFMSSITGAFELMEWAEDEIDRAQRRHPAAADAIWHSFKLVCPRDASAMSTEFVYRAHCAELLDRVAAGADTRPGTAAEICIACCETSQIAPFTETATGLYARMFALVSPKHAAGVWRDQAPHYEALRGPDIDEAERDMRRRLADPDRRLGAIECQGQHRGTAVACRYAPSSAAAAA